MSTTKLETALEVFHKDGIVALDELISADEVAAIRENGEAIRAKYHDKYGATSPVKTRGGWRLDIPPVNLVRSKATPLARAVGRMMSNPLIQSACQAILGPNWNVTALVFDYREPTDDPLPPEKFEKGYPPAYFWHADHGNPGKTNPDIFTLRFQIYLNDTDFERGALGYVPGTQRLVKYMRELIKEIVPDAAQRPVLDTLTSLVDGKAFINSNGRKMAPEFEAQLDDLMRKVPRYDYASASDIYAGKAGTVLMFDDTGMHRGNFVHVDHRYICRCLCMPSGKLNQYTNWVSLKNSLARTYYKATLNEPFRSLM